MSNHLFSQRFSLSLSLSFVCCLCCFKLNLLLQDKTSQRLWLSSGTSVLRLFWQHHVLPVMTKENWEWSWNSIDYFRSRPALRLILLAFASSSSHSSSFTLKRSFFSLFNLIIFSLPSYIQESVMYFSLLAHALQSQSLRGTKFMH